MFINLLKKEMQNSCMEVFVFSFFFFFLSSFFLDLALGIKNMRILGAVLVGHVLRRLIGSSGFLNRERERTKERNKENFLYVYNLYFSLSVSFVISKKKEGMLLR